MPTATTYAAPRSTRKDRVVRSALRAHVPLALFVVTVAGCSQPAAGTRSAAADGEGATGAAEVRLNKQDRRSLYLAEETHVASCMRDKGFEYRVVPPPPDERIVRPYGNDDVEHAQRRGYNLPATGAPAAADGDGAGPMDANATYVRSLAPARQAEFQAALTGPTDAPTGSVVLADGTEVGFTLTGCVGDARKRLYGNADRYLTLATFVENLETEIGNRVFGDAKYVAALGRWRTCMREQGVDVRTPAAALEVAAKEPAREKAIAVLDARCSRKSALAATGAQLDRIHKARVYREYEGRVTAYSEMMRKAAARAKRALREG